MCIRAFVIIFSFLLVSALPAQERRHVIIPKLGSYKLDTQRSYIFDFDKSSDQVYGFEYERRFSTGLTIGAEHIHFENDYIDTDINRADTFKANIIYFKSKYYFRMTEWMPYLMVGAGYGTAKTSLNGTAIDGASYQYGAGIAYEWQRFGVQFEYKNIQGKFDRDSWGALVLATDEVDIGGQGFFLGMSIKF